MKRTFSLKTKLVACTTTVAFAAMGCGAGQDSAEDPGAREVTMEVLTNVADDSGARQMQSFGTTTLTLDEFPSWTRSFVIDGGESTDLGQVRDGAEIVIPLNTGETATVRREGDRFELVAFTGEDDGTAELPRGAVSAVRMLDSEIQVFLSGGAGDQPDTIVRLSGIDDLDQERAALVTALALNALLVSLEDGEQIVPAVAIAIIAAIVGAAWLALCGGLAWECAYRCQNYAGFQTQCAGVTVNINPTSVQVGGGYSCRCL
jgi:hypothetical protein